MYGTLPQICAINPQGSLLLSCVVLQSIISPPNSPLSRVPRRCNHERKPNLPLQFLEAPHMHGRGLISAHERGETCQPSLEYGSCMPAHFEGLLGPLRCLQGKSQSQLMLLNESNAGTEPKDHHGDLEEEPVNPVLAHQRAASALEKSHTALHAPVKARLSATCRTLQLPLPHRLCCIAAQAQSLMSQGPNIDIRSGGKQGGHPPHGAGRG